MTPSVTSVAAVGILHASAGLKEEEVVVEEMAAEEKEVAETEGVEMEGETAAEIETEAVAWVAEDPVELATTVERVAIFRRSVLKLITSPATGVEEVDTLPVIVPLVARTPVNATTVATAVISPRNVLNLVKVQTGEAVTDVGRETTLPVNVLSVIGPAVTTARTWATLPRIAQSQLEPVHASLLLTLNCGLLGGSPLLLRASKPR